MDARTKAFRRAIDAHWQIEERLGAHFPQFSDAVRAGEAFRLDGLANAAEALAEGNWAKHSPPPNAWREVPPMPVDAIGVWRLEQFREKIFVGEESFGVELQLTAKDMKEGEAEAKVYNEFFERCEDTTTNIGYAIETAEEKWAKLEAKINELNTNIESASSKIDDLAASSATILTIERADEEAYIAPEGPL